MVSVEGVRALDGSKPLVAEPFHTDELHSRAGHARKPLRVGRARRGDGVLHDDDALTDLEQAERRLGDADVGLEAAEDDVVPVGPYDVGDDLRTRGEVEDRLRVRGSPWSEGVPDGRGRLAVALRLFLRDDDRHSGPAREPAQPPDPIHDGRRLRHRQLPEEAGLSVDHDEDAAVRVQSAYHAPDLATAALA